MKNILVPIGSAADAQRAAERAISQCGGEPVRVHLLHVQRPLPRHVSRFFPRSELHAFHQDAGLAVLAPAARALDAAGVTHDENVIVGHAAEVIVEFAERYHCADIVLDTTSQQGLLSFLHGGSITSQVQHLMRVHAETRAADVRAVQ